MTGATLGKGLLRGIGTLLGGGLGCLVAILADEFGKIGNNIVVGTSVFLFGKDLHIPLASSYSFKVGASNRITHVIKFSAPFFFFSLFSPNMLCVLCKLLSSNGMDQYNL